MSSLVRYLLYQLSHLQNSYNLYIYKNDQRHISLGSFYKHNHQQKNPTLTITNAVHHVGQATAGTGPGKFAGTFAGSKHANLFGR